MANADGSLRVTVEGKEYRLFLGMSVLADLQDKHGQDVLQKLDPPAGAPDNWMPPLSVVVDLLLGALQRYHADEADRWLVDDLLKEGGDVLTSLIASAFPEQNGEPAGNAKRPKAAA